MTVKYIKNFSKIIKICLANDWLEKNPDKFSSAAWTLQTGRSALPFRRAVSASGAVQAAAALRQQASPIQPRSGTGVVFVFPGQGAQHPRMGAETYQRDAVFRAQFDLCAGLFRTHARLDLMQFLEGQGAQVAATLTETRYTQPALFAVEYAFARMLTTASDFTVVELELGHSRRR